MSRIAYDLSPIKAFIFDVDGVLSCETISLHPSGEPMRSVNIKDGYAIQLAVKMGYEVAIITGANTNAIKVRFESLGVKHIYMGAHTKTVEFAHFLSKTNLLPHQILYMGDDIPDMKVMQLVGLPCAPADAVPEIKEVAQYVSLCKGGYGCGRDVIEQVMKAQGNWLQGDAFGW